MKKFTFLLLAVLFIGITAMTNQDTKVAHINTAELVEMMPAMKSAQSQLESLQKRYDTEIRGMAQELDDKIKRYGAEADLQTDAENKKRAEEVQTMQNNIAEYRQQAIQDLQKKEGDILSPIIEQAKVAIQKVARAKGYQYVYDATPGGGLLVADGYNLLADVKSELGI